MLCTLNKNIPLDESFDILVIGGGPSGVAAAIGAAREGAKTLIIESMGCLGGMGTSGLVPAWCPFTDGRQVVYNGIAKKVFYASKKAINHVAIDDFNGWQPIDPEFLKLYYDKIVSEENIEVLFHTQLCSVEMIDSSTVDKVVVSNKHGLSAFKAKVYIDCTGDGDLAFWAGAQAKTGDDDNIVQPGTLCFIISNIDSYAFLCGKADENNIKTGNWVYEGSPSFKIVNKDKYPDILDSHLCGNLIGPGTIGFNAGHVFDVDSTDPKNTSKNMMIGRKLATSIKDALSEYEPKVFANSYLASTAMIMGVRESRRVIGDYVLTVDDYLERKTFDDEISRNCYKIDIHQSQEVTGNTNSYEGFMKYEENNETHKGAYMRYQDGESHGIPYRCLTPKGLTNVLVAGRCISTDRKVQGSTRVMPVCLSTGEAAGIAAYLALNVNNHDVHNIDVDLLQQKIIANGGNIK